MKKVQPKVKKIINKSIEEARLYNEVEIKIEHIMIALINDYDNDAIKYLVELGVEVDDLHAKLEQKIFNEETGEEDVKISLLPMSEYTKKLIKEAEFECDKLKESYLSTTHIMLSILKEKNILGMDPLEHTKRPKPEPKQQPKQQQFKQQPKQAHNTSKPTRKSNCPKYGKKRKYLSQPGGCNHKA